MKKNKKFVVLGAGWCMALFFLLMIVSPAHGIVNLPEVEPGERAPIDSTFDEPLSRALDYVYSTHFDKAITLLDKLKKAYPDHPAPYFYIAATYQMWMSSYRFNEFQEELEENIQQAIDIGNELMKKDDDPWLNFYVGAAYGFRAFYRFRKHNWIGAYFDAKKGISNFRIALEKDPELYDCYLGLGSYYYWRTAKSKLIRVVAFWMQDKRRLGLDQLQLSIDHGRYCSREATYALIAAHYDYGQFDQALKPNNNAMAFADPPSTPALYMRGRLFTHFGRWSEAETIFRQILNRLVDFPYQSIGYQVECKYWIAEALKATGKHDQAYELCVEALTQSTKRNKEIELENPVDGFDDIKERLEELHKSLKKELGR